MKASNENNDEDDFWMAKIVNFITTAIGWLIICASPSLIGIIVGVIACFYFERSLIGIIIGASLALTGIICGILWAERVRKTKGTVEFLTVLVATPEYDIKKPTDKVELDNEKNSTKK